MDAVQKDDFGRYLVGSDDEIAGVGRTSVSKPTIDNTTSPVATIKPVDSCKRMSLSDDLKMWRKRTADELLKPVFSVVRNVVIEELVLKKPRTLEELSQLTGVGPVTIQKYGQAILAIVARYKDKDDAAGMQEETTKMDMSFWSDDDRDCE